MELSEKEIKDYFTKFKHRGAYYVHMKYLASKYLRSSGYPYERIALVIFGDSRRHETIQYYLKKYVPSFNTDVSKCRYWKSWIKKSIYPLSLVRREPIVRKRKTGYYDTFTSKQILCLLNLDQANKVLEVGCNKRTEVFVKKVLENN